MDQRCFAEGLHNLTTFDHICVPFGRFHAVSFVGGAKYHNH